MQSRKFPPSRLRRSEGGSLALFGGSIAAPASDALGIFFTT